MLPKIKDRIRSWSHPRVESHHWDSALVPYAYLRSSWSLAWRTVRASTENNLTTMGGATKHSLIQDTTTAAFL